MVTGCLFLVMSAFLLSICTFLTWQNCCKGRYQWKKTLQPDTAIAELGFSKMRVTIVRQLSKIGWSRHLPLWDNPGTEIHFLASCFCASGIFPKPARCAVLGGERAVTLSWDKSDKSFRDLCYRPGGETFYIQAGGKTLILNPSLYNWLTFDFLFY